MQVGDPAVRPDREQTAAPAVRSLGDVDALFPGTASVAVCLPSLDTDSIEPVARLLRSEAHELAVELGAPVKITTAPTATTPRLELVVDPATSAPRLTVDRSVGIARAVGATLDDAVAALSLLRTLRARGGSQVNATPTDHLPEALDRLEQEVGWTAPAIGLYRIDWRATSREYRRLVDAADPVPGMQRWTATLRDMHTGVHTLPPPGALPYRAMLRGDTIWFCEVPEGTPAHDAGIRPGARLEGVNALDLLSRWGAPPQLRPWLVGRRALAGPAGTPREFTVRRTDRTTITLVDTPSHLPHDPAATWHRRPSGTGVLRIHQFVPGLADLVDVALTDLASCDRLLVDLRGNPGGSLVAAIDLRERFLLAPRHLGLVRHTIGDGRLSNGAPITGTPSSRTRFTGRVRFLVDGMTCSAAEDAILGLSQLDRVDVAGQPTGGGSGRARSLPLLPDTVLTVSTALTYDHRGRVVEGRGIHVDVPLAPDRNGIVPLEAADRAW
jgi:carboxyl-terminal processing protease